MLPVYKVVQVCRMDRSQKNLDSQKQSYYNDFGFKWPNYQPTFTNAVLYVGGGKNLFYFSQRSA